jgi:ATP-dependent exoDNAse (exonuclease V) beta subunit
VPIDFSQKGMTGTIYERDYEEEHLQNVVDNLNLLYVAFTRASISLQVIGKRNAKNNRSALLEMVLSPTANLLPGSNLSGETDEQAPLRFLYGSMQLQQTQEQTCIPHENIFLQKSTPVEVDIEVFAQKTQFRQSNRSRSFAVADDDDEQLQRYRYIQMGTVLHQLFSTIRTQADIPEALRRMEFEGIIYDQTLTRERIEQMISKRLSVPQIADWF